MRKWTGQEQLLRAIGLSQARIAKLEGGDSGISLDLMIKASAKTIEKNRSEDFQRRVGTSMI